MAPIKRVVRFPNGFIRTRGSGRATRKDLVERFQKLMNNNRGGIVDFPLDYIEDDKLEEALEPLRRKCHGILSDEELLEGAQLAKVGHLLETGKSVHIKLSEAAKAQLEIQRSPAFWKEPKELLVTLFACSLASLTQGWDQAANGNLGWPNEFGLELDPRHPEGRDVWIFGAIQAIMWFSAAILGSYLSDPISEHIGRRGALFVASICSFAAVFGGSRAQSWQELFVTRIVLGLGVGGKASVVPVLESEVVPAAKRGRLLVGWQIFVATGLFAGYTASYILRDSWRHQILSGAIPAFALVLFTWISCESPRWLIIQGKHAKAFETLVRLRKERVLAAKELVSIYYQIQAERWLFSGAKSSDEESVDGDNESETNPFDPEQPRTSYWRRLINHFAFPRIRRAAIACMIVMLSQQLSGINIIAFLATTFFTTAGLRPGSEVTAEIDSYKLAIGWGAANAIFSCWAYFLVENEEEPITQTEISSHVEQSEIGSVVSSRRPSLDDIDEDPPSTLDEDAIAPVVSREPRNGGPPSHKIDFQLSSKGSKRNSKALSDIHEMDGIIASNRNSQIPSARSSIYSETAPPDTEDDDDDRLYDYGDPSSKQLRGRRFLLLLSLGGGAVSLLVTALCFNIPEGSSARMPFIALFIVVFTLFYSLGAGAVAFLYCAEVFPNEGREIGMSWSTFWNFGGAGLLALFVPFGINWGHGKLLGLFSGFNVIAFILVYFLVPSTNQIATLEDMSYIFGRKTRDHAKAQFKRLFFWKRNKVQGPRLKWRTGQGKAGSSIRTLEDLRRGNGEAKDGLSDSGDVNGEVEGRGKGADIRGLESEEVRVESKDKMV